MSDGLCSSVDRTNERMNERTNDRASTVTLAHAPRVNNYNSKILNNFKFTQQECARESACVHPISEYGIDAVLKPIIEYLRKLENVTFL